MKSWFPFTLLLLVGCENAVSVIDAADASLESDAGPDAASDAGLDLGVDTGARSCRVVDDAAWSDVPSPSMVTQKLDWGTGRFAIHGDTTMAYGENTLLYSASRGAAFEAFPRDGLPDDHQIKAIGWVDGTWWMNVGTPVETGWLSFVYAWNEDTHTWTSVGELDMFVVDFVQTDSLVLLYTASLSVYRRVDETHFALAFDPPEEWWRGVLDVAATNEFIYLTTEDENGHVAVMRTSDGIAWNRIAIDLEEGEDITAADLAASGTTVVLNTTWSNTEYFLLDESDGSDTFMRFPTDHLVQPVWFADDGTVIGRVQVGSTTDFYAAASLAGPWTHLVGKDFQSFSLGSGFDYYFIQSEGSRIVHSRAIAFSQFSIEESADHGVSWTASVTELVPGVISDLTSDGSTLLVRATHEDGTHGLFVRDGDVPWRESTIPGVSLGSGSVSVVGVGTRYLARPSTFGDSTPYISSDHGLSWSQLANAWPSYFSNTGTSWRNISGVALASDGSLLVGTVGGQTALEGTGSKVGWAYRTGSGIWQLGESNVWEPSNAGVPIEADGEYGGPPFRADVQSIVARGDDAFASLVGRGVYKLVAGRWQVFGAGLPVESSSAQLVSTREDVFAFTNVGVYVLEGDIWTALDLGTPTTVLVGQGNLLVRADAAHVETSIDGGETFVALPALAGVARIAVSDRELFVATNNNTIHALALVCESAE